MSNLLRPHQRAELIEDQRVLQGQLGNPYVQDKGAINKQLQKLSRQLETQSPKPYASGEVDKMVKREKELLGEITNGMLTQEEMRKSPPGAVSKHMAWEKANKKKIQEWKEINLRLNHDTDDRDVVNLEKYRPSSGGMLSMAGALIPGKQYYFPENIEPKNVMSDADREILSVSKPRHAK